MRSELGPLLRGATRRECDGVELYELPSALVAIGGIGHAAGTRAAEAVVREANPGILISAGLAGALSPSLKVGDMVRACEVVDEATGERYETTGGDAVLVTALRVTGMKGKQRLAAGYSASAVDMEGAAGRPDCQATRHPVYGGEGHLRRALVPHAAGERIRDSGRATSRRGFRCPCSGQAQVVAANASVGAK